MKSRSTTGYVKSLPLLIALATALPPAATAAGCSLEVDGQSHEMPHVYVVASPTTVSDLQGVHPVTEHWVLCTMAPLEPDPELMGDPLGAYQMAALMLDDDDRVEVQLAHDGRVRRVNANQGDFVASSALDGELPISFSGSFSGGRAEGRLATRGTILQEPTPWYDRDAQWALSIDLDGVPVVGAAADAAPAGVSTPPPAPPSAAASSASGGESAVAGLSPEAREAGDGLRALAAALPQPSAIVQLVVFPGSMVTATVEAGGEIVDYRYVGGTVQGPEPMDPQYLACRTALPPGSVDLATLAPLWDDAPRRAGTPDKGTLQIVVSQHPCGTPWIHATVEGPKAVYYDGDGGFLRTD